MTSGERQRSTSHVNMTSVPGKAAVGRGQWNDLPRLGGTRLRMCA